MNENIVEEVKKDIPDILSGNVEKLVEDAKKFGEYLGKNGLTTSQIRNIFSDVKKLDKYDTDKTNLLLLRPKLAYVAGRHGKRTKVIKELHEVIDACIIQVKDNQSLKNFKDFFEAIIAYHKYYGKE
ncbi:type III-A CRISPR-associated protein Csm2 [Thermoplasmatales archaeon ex4484_30]|nr:MAG: type III-A CRISPR-associated protein Csm2 [Thermoplasmatales archaeon ex4484_30]